MAKRIQKLQARELSVRAVKERAAVFNVLVLELAAYNLADVAQHAGVSTTTLYNWVHGDTIAPRLSTMIPVANAIGMDLKLVKKC